MNNVSLVGRLVRDPEVRYGQNESVSVAKFSLAVERRFKRDGDPTVDFINCTVFGKSAEFTEKYFRKGMRVAITGRIQTGSYKNKDGQTVFTTEIIVESQEIAQSKSESNESSTASNAEAGKSPYGSSGDDFMSIPEGAEDELPFS
ncbi:Single-stranded DNA-binding protein ssbB [[Ruminococcus] torques]|jgi:single-strand DNA-binding protein|nr:Single-stranded DNA-binding protein ssbB [[Ruminococcus] torques]